MSNQSGATEVQTNEQRNFMRKTPRFRSSASSYKKADIAVNNYWEVKTFAIESYKVHLNPVKTLQTVNKLQLTPVI